METTEEPLPGGWRSGATRRGAAVLRRAGPQSATVISFLRHLHASGVTFVPEPLESGFAADGREQLTFIEGESPHPHSWSDEAVWEIGRMLRQVHDAGATFVPETEPTWQPGLLRSLGVARPTIGHGDLGPWNILALQGRPTAFIDWDDAGPVDPVWELASVAWLNAQLHDDDVAVLNDLGPVAHRAHQARLLLDGYRLVDREHAGFVDLMIEFAIRSVREEAVVCGVTPTTTSPAANGFPTLWALAWRARAAAWMLDHHSQLQSALEH